MMDILVTLEMLCFGLHHYEACGATVKCGSITEYCCCLDKSCRKMEEGRNAWFLCHGFCCTAGQLWEQVLSIHGLLSLHKHSENHREGHVSWTSLVTILLHSKHMLVHRGCTNMQMTYSESFRKIAHCETSYDPGKVPIRNFLNSPKPKLCTILSAIACKAE